MDQAWEDGLCIFNALIPDTVDCRTTTSHIFALRALLTSMSTSSHLSPLSWYWYWNNRGTSPTAKVKSIVLSFSRSVKCSVVLQCVTSMLISFIISETPHLQCVAPKPPQRLPLATSSLTLSLVDAFSLFILHFLYFYSFNIF